MPRPPAVRTPSLGELVVRTLTRSAADSGARAAALKSCARIERKNARFLHMYGSCSQRICMTSFGAGGTAASVSVTVQLFSEPSGTIHLDVVRPHRPCGRRALGKRDSRCAQVRTAGDTHLYHEVYRKVREDLKDLNGYDLQLIARDETARVDMRAMLEARDVVPDSAKRRKRSSLGWEDVSSGSMSHGILL